MTCYFDAVHRQIHETRQLARSLWWHRFSEIEQKLVWDTTIGAELLPDTPAHAAVREAVHRAVLRWGTTERVLPLDPATLKCRRATLSDEDPDGDFADRLDALCWDLHTAFHEVARLGGSDEPGAPLQAIYARGELRREAMVTEAQKSSAETDALPGPMVEVVP